jgi:Spy/CpxP family protein refolding chaperone
MMMMDPGDLCPMEGGPSLHGYPWRMRLTDTQREQAEKIMDRSRTRLSALREQKQAAQARLREALSASNRNQPEIMQAYREAATLREREFEIQLETQREFDQLLGR